MFGYEGKIGAFAGVVFNFVGCDARREHPYMRTKVEIAISFGKD
jgi:hypothetical protein